MKSTVSRDGQKQYLTTSVHMKIVRLYMWENSTVSIQYKVQKVYTLKATATYENLQHKEMHISLFLQKHDGKKYT